MPLGVEGELGVADVIAAVRVGGERLAALARPLDGAADPARGPGDEQLLGVVEDLRAEAAADVGRDHPQLVLGHVQRERGHEQPDEVRVLRGRVQRVRVAGGVVAAVGGAGLHRVRRDAAVGEVELDDVRGGGERGVGGGGVAEVPVEADVALGGVPHERRAGGGGVGEAADGGQGLVVDLDEPGGGAGGGLRRRDHHRDGIADVARHALREGGVRRLDHVRAVLALDEPPARDAAEVVGGDVVAGEHGEHAGGGERGGRVDLVDLGVRVHRAHEHRVALVRQRDVVGVRALAEQEAAVFLAPERRADALGRGCRGHHLPPRIEAAPARTALTMLW